LGIGIGIFGAPPAEGLNGLANWFCCGTKAGAWGIGYDGTKERGPPLFYMFVGLNCGGACCYCEG